MAQHGISESTKLTGKSKRTLYRYMDAGKLTYETDREGHRLIDTSELIRVFGTLKTRDDTVPVAQPDTDENNSLSHDYIRFLKEQLRMSQEREEKLIEHLEQAQLLLEHQQSIPKKAERKGSIFKKLGQNIVNAIP